VLGIIGVNSSFVASTVVPLLQKTKTAFASVSVPPELLSPPRDGIYKTIAKEDQQGAAQVDFVANLARSGDLPKTPRVALLRFDSPASVAWAKGAKARAAKDGVSIVADQNYPLGGKDVSSQAIKIAASHADVILLYILPAEASMVLNAVNNAGVGHDVPMVGYFADSSRQFLEQMSGRPYYGLADYNATATGPLAAQIAADAKRVGASPDEGLFNEGYALGLLAQAALEKCGKSCNRSSFNDALGGLSSDLDGFGFGPFAVTADQHAGLTKVAFVKLEGGKVVQAGEPISLTSSGT